MVSIPTNKIVNSGQIYVAHMLYSSYRNSTGPWCCQGTVAVTWEQGVPAWGWPVDVKHFSRHSHQRRGYF